MTRQRGSRHIGRGSPPGRLRIVAGKWRSRLLNIASVPGLRPTAERIRETLFNWLAARIQGKRCLDLFAGTGALGFEALSRGASTVTFVEKSKEAAAMLREASAELDAAGARIECRDAIEFLRGGCQDRYDLVFLDPPFADNSLAELCKLLNEQGFLSTQAQVYLEQEKAGTPPDLPDGWTVAHEKTAGNVRYSLVNTS